MLSGDLLGDDGPSFANNAENSYRVVTADGLTETTVLDGFTITAGNNDRPAEPAHWGGGMYAYRSSLGIANVVFRANSAMSGGGLFTEGGGPLLSNVTFAENRATYNGGGMHTLGLSSPALSHVIFISNTTTGAAGSGHGYGGGMFNAASSKPTLTDAVFTGNAAANSGGGVYNASSQLDAARGAPSRPTPPCSPAAPYSWTPAAP